MSGQYSYPTYAKLIHLGMAVFGVFAFITGELAEDGITSSGYTLHSYLGLSLASIILIRVAMGFTHSPALSFKAWSPFSKQQRQYVIDDFRSFLTLKIPKRDRHDGLAGFTQAFGLLVFIWMSVTGTILFMLGSESKSNLFEYVVELHEVGESLIPLFLAIHVGAVILHILCGNTKYIN
jgi:cytochrome b561